jgi:hypothetical protein
MTSREARPRFSARRHQLFELVEHRTSQVTGKSFPYLCPALRPRPVRLTLPLRSTRCYSHLLNNENTSAEIISGLNHTASVHPVYASSNGLPHSHARLGSGRWLGFAGRDSNPLNFNRRFPSATISPATSLILALSRKFGRGCTHPAQIRDRPEGRGLNQHCL